MRLSKLAVAALSATVFFTDCSGQTPVGPVPLARAARALQEPLGPRSIVTESTVKQFALCAPSTDPGRAACLSTIRTTQDSVTSAYPDAVDGLTPNDLSSIYGYPLPAAQGGTSGAIGLVVAFDNPKAEADLAVYRSYFGLPACTTMNGCFHKIVALPALFGGSTGNASSITAHPTTTIQGWSAEGEADIETASAVCSHCKILLVEAASDDLADLGNAVLTADLAGATVINASFGAPESASQTSMQGVFAPFGSKVVAAAGDSGPGVLFPAASPSVVAVAGTTIAVSGMTVSETLWSGSGGGCSAVFPRLALQPGWCPKRSVADLAAVADPGTGLAFYDSALGGWSIVGGTSVAAPIVSGMFAMSGDTLFGSGAQQLYANASSYAPVAGGGTIAGLGAPTGLSAF